MSAVLLPTVYSMLLAAAGAAATLTPAWPRRRRRIAAGVFLTLAVPGVLAPAPYWWAAAICLAAFLLAPGSVK
ncbi:hypothetical protein F3K40_15340 [Streptomyces sp. LBUM 1478]|uniref:hypothetical protein n=1 Tax=Streptomyces scabiei TaxID=1930 RepID=UPI0007658AE2|nr:hypothetical protein [Streptomyces scabiei]MBP5906831.1 hypothetical protein [Streptomyces sp. LBUM 1478]MBP5930443.1 hypothetical protein [Streptomyces sp. LBUM 1479]